MQRLLQAYGVTSVQSSEASVLDQPEARELRRVLGAILDPADGRRVRSALVTPVFGLVGADLIRLEDDDAAWDEWVERFPALATGLEGIGALAGGTRPPRRVPGQARLLAMADGERRVTNLTHVAELLHAADFESRLGPDA